jgi:hypothetical protein
VCSRLWHSEFRVACIVDFLGLPRKPARMLFILAPFTGTFYCTNATNFVQQLKPLAVGNFCGWFPTRLLTKSPWRHSHRFRFVITQNTFRFLHWRRHFHDHGLIAGAILGRASREASRITNI